MNSICKIMVVQGLMVLLSSGPLVLKVLLSASANFQMHFPFEETFKIKKNEQANAI